MNRSVHWISILPKSQSFSRWELALVSKGLPLLHWSLDLCGEGQRQQSNKPLPKFNGICCLVWLSLDRFAHFNYRFLECSSFIVCIRNVNIGNRKCAFLKFLNKKLKKKTLNYIVSYLAWIKRFSSIFFLERN